MLKKFNADHTGMSASSSGTMLQAVNQPMVTLWTNRSVWLLVGTGILLRVARYMENRSLWLDEAMLSLNIAGLDFSGLAGQLSHHQSAPLGFLWLEKAAVNLFGINEYALRLVPLIMGCAALPVFYLAVRRVLPSWGRVFAVGMLALGEMPIYYASEVKQYSGDILMTVLILWLGLRAMDTDSMIRDLMILCLAGVTGMWVSHSVIFVLTGVAIVLLMSFLRHGRRTMAAGMVGLGCVWATSFLIEYFLFLRSLTEDPYLQEWWKKSGGFLPFPPISMDEIRQYAKVALQVGRDLFVNHLEVGRVINLLGALAVGCSAIGALRLLQDRRWNGALVLAPAGLVVIASMLEIYPLYDRLVLFLYPVIILLIAASVISLSDRWGRKVGIISAAILLIVPTMSAGKGFFSAPGRDELRPVIRYVAAHQEKADVLFLLGGSEAGTRFYNTYDSECDLGGIKVVLGQTQIWKPEWSNINELDELRSHTNARRVWVVISTTWDRYYRVQEKRMLVLFDAAGARVDEIQHEGAAGYLYVLHDTAR